MSCRVHVDRSAKQPERRVELALDRPKRIDAFIDYFASGDTRRLDGAADPCGDALLDEDGAR